MKRRFLVCVTLAGVAACVPTDASETVRGAIFLRIAPSTASDRTFVTSDGWTVRLDRVLTLVTTSVRAVPTAPFSDPPSCSSTRAGRESYGFVDLDYGFVLEDRGRPPETCAVAPRFVATPAGRNLPRGEGITNEDIEGLARSERVSAVEPLLFSAARFIGVATRGLDRVAFDWWIPQTRTTDPRFRRPPPDDFAVVDIPNGEKVDVAFSFDAVQLFRVSMASDASTRFQIFAEADENEDGIVTGEELEIAMAELGDEVAAYTLPALELSIRDFLGLQLPFGWRVAPGR